MSTLIVEVCKIEKVCKIEEVLPHNNADALDLSQIKGWQCVTPKGKYAPGDLVTYIPIDAVIPAEYSDRPPTKISVGDAEPSHPLFGEYTDVENLRNFPSVLTEGEKVSVLEKIHGTSRRLGLIEGEWMAGSILSPLGISHRQVILYGEVYGGKVQSLSYGQTGASGFRAFDPLADGKYLDADDFAAHCARFGVLAVPVLYRGSYALETIKALSEGATTRRWGGCA